MRPLETELRAGLRALELTLADGQVAQLLDYLVLIQKWNKVYNLTALREPALMLSHHLLDSLAAVPALRRQLAERRPAAGEGEGEGEGGSSSRLRLRLLDVGAGAGLPGVVIAICCPDVAVTCVDTVAKKAAFVQQAAVALKLPNLRGLHARVESLTGQAGGYDIVSSRAFASLRDFTSWSRGALAPEGIWLAMKGKTPDEEMAQLPSQVEVFHVEQLAVPGLDAERCIVWMRQAAA